MTTPPRVSVIIAVFNGARHLSAQTDALLAQRGDFPWEVIYVNNESTDTSRELIAAHISISHIFRQGVTYGRPNVLLYLKFRKHGAQRRSLRSMVRVVKQTHQSLGGLFETPRC
jgi:glycosyltransferase involved in cell wall biosynthesis